MKKIKLLCSICFILILSFSLKSLEIAFAKESNPPLLMDKVSTFTGTLEQLVIRDGMNLSISEQTQERWELANDFDFNEQVGKYKC